MDLKKRSIRVMKQFAVATTDAKKYITVTNGLIMLSETEFDLFDELIADKLVKMCKQRKINVEKLEWLG